MSQYERRMDYLNNSRIIYRREPINDKPSKVYSWGYLYEHGTYEHYELFRSKAKINTYKSLKWHLYVLWYLNPSINETNFKKICRFICKKSNGFVTFEISDELLEKMIHDVSLMDLETPPPNKLRKIIFKDFSGLTTKQKLSIVGQMIGRSKISDTEIYDAMVMLNSENIKITVKKLASYLNCSTRTIYRNMSGELKKEKELLNQNNEKV